MTTDPHLAEGTVAKRVRKRRPTLLKDLFSVSNE
jgi:hypothetical protein